MFNVGDVVTVRDDLIPYTRYGREIFVREMRCMCGQKVTIKCVDNGTYKISEFDYHWTNEMFKEKLT